MPGRPPLHPGRPRGERQRLLLLALIQANPGIHILRAAHLLGLNWNTCHYHAQRLAGEERITICKVGSHVCLFDRRDGAMAHRVAPLLLRGGRTASLVQLIFERPGASQKSLASGLGMAPSSIHRYLLRLEKAGLVERVHDGREVATFATEALTAAWSGPASSASEQLMPLPQPAVWPADSGLA
ncbi:MAG: winged helix-turn-helix transcriptional regulator [Thermoplasmatota archaeon]